MSIKEINEILSETVISDLPNKLREYQNDSRSGVVKLVEKYQKKILLYQKEIELWELKCEFDDMFSEEGILVGIDEVGRGPLAGPVVAAAVILPKNSDLIGLKDSKKLTEAKREELYQKIQKQAISIGTGIVDAETIDQINILQATFMAMRQAINNLQGEFDKILVDGDKIIPEVNKKQEAIIGGDDKSASIAAASVIAKVTRDRMMKAYSNTFSQYDWESNKGYGSKSHYEAIRKYGITPLHRKSFLKKEGIS